MVSELDRRPKSASVHGSRLGTGPEGVKEDPRGGDSRQGVFSLVASARASRRDEDALHDAAGKSPPLDGLAEIRP